jgi:hypothetical protein
MREYFFQIVLFLSGAAIGITTQFWTESTLRQMAAILAVLLVVTSLLWLGYEIGLKESTRGSTPTAAARPTPVRRRRIAVTLAVLLVVASLVWVAYEIYLKESTRGSTPTAVAGTTLDTLAPALELTYPPTPAPTDISVSLDNTPTLVSMYTPEVPTPTNMQTKPPVPTSCVVEITDLIVTSERLTPKEEMFIVANLRISTSAIPVTYTWNVEAGNIKAGQYTNAILYETPDAPGIYTIWLRVECGNQDVEKSVSIVVTPALTTISTEPPPIGTIMSPTPIPIVDQTPVTLTSPANNTSFVGKDERVELQWKEWYRKLEEGEYYFVDVEFTALDEDGKCRESWTYLKWTRDNSFVVDPWLYDIICPSFDKRTVEWTVYVAQEPATDNVKRQDVRQLSVEAERWSFQWALSGSSGSSGTGGGGIVVPPLEGTGPKP